MNRGAGDRVNLAETWIRCVGGLRDIVDLGRNKAMIEVKSNLNNEREIEREIFIYTVIYKQRKSYLHLLIKIHCLQL